MSSHKNLKLAERRLLYIKEINRQLVKKNSKFNHNETLIEACRTLIDATVKPRVKISAVSQVIETEQIKDTITIIGFVEGAQEIDTSATENEILSQN